MSFLSSFSTALRTHSAPLNVRLGAQVQTPTDTIDKLVERIQTSPSVDDRRTAVLGLKGCCREYKEEVGTRSLSSLIAVLQYDAPQDGDIAKAVLETLMGVFEVGEKPTRDDPGLRFQNEFFQNPEPTHSLLTILFTSPSFYPRFYTLQLLSLLLIHNAHAVQTYILGSPPPGVDALLSVLDAGLPSTSADVPSSSSNKQEQMSGGAGEMLRNETLLLLPQLIQGNADLQKIVAFSGAFERLLRIIEGEGGVEGGIVVQDAMVGMGGLLRYNASNQNYFRELSLIPLLPPMLYFPFPAPPIDTPAPDDFTLQYWPEQKVINTGLVLGLIRMLVGGPGGGNQSAMATSGVTRCLIELALSSNAPPALKAQATNTLIPIMLTSPPNQSLLSQLSLAPLVAVPANEEHPNGGFVRLPMRPAVLALVGNVVEGADVDPSAGRALKGRAAGVNMFEAFIIGNDDARDFVLSGMDPSLPVAGVSDPTRPYEPPVQTAGNIILNAIVETPLPGRPVEPYRILFACLLMAHLIRGSEKAKTATREIRVPPAGAGGPVGESGDVHEHAIMDDDDEEHETLLQVVVGNLMLAQREQADCANRAAKEGAGPGGVSGRHLGMGVAGGISEEEADWNRVMVGYLVLLCTWLWESPKTVRAFLDESDLQVLIGPITQSTGVDSLVQGLSAFLLGVCYEFNREPGEVTRATLHPILHSRIGPDQFVSRMARLREDPRFKAVQPDQFDQEDQDALAVAPPAVPPTTPGLEEFVDDEAEVWFDWAFVDFWKNNYYTIQRAIAVEPDAIRGALADDSEAAGVIVSLREKIQSQTQQIDVLRQKLATQAKEHEADRAALTIEIGSLSEQVRSLTAEVESLRTAADRSEKMTADLRGSADASHQQELVAVQEQLASSTSDLQAERQKLEDMQQSHADETKELRETLASREGDLEEVRRQLANSKAELEKVSQDAAESGKAEEIRLNVELDEARQSVARLQAEIATLKEGEDEHTRASTKAQEDLQVSQRKVEELTTQMSNLEEQAKELELLKSERDSLQGQLEKAQKDINIAAAANSGKGKKGKGGDQDKLQKELDALKKQVEEEKGKREETEKEHEDLLVLLEELSTKRKKDKVRMREKGLDVSDDEDEGDEDEDEDDAE